MKTKVLITGAVLFFVLSLVVIVFLAWGFYGRGKGMAEKECAEEKIVEVIKEKEVVKYVYKEKAQIWSAPNAHRDELVGLYISNEF